MRKFVSWCSFCTILAAYCMASLLSGVAAANWFVDALDLKGAWCLLGIVPLFIASSAVALFICEGLKKFGEYDG